MDPLSDLLTLIRPQDFGFRGIDAGSDWGLRYPVLPGIKVYSIRRGECCAIVDGEEPITLRAGHILVVSGAVGFRLASRPQANTRDALPFLKAIAPGAVGMIDGGGDCFGIGGYFSLAGDVLHRMRLGLPETHLFDEGRETWLLDGLIDRIVEDLREPRPGGRLFAEHLAQCVLIETIRAVSARSVAGTPGLLRGLQDERLHAAIAAMHADPGRAWTLAELSSTASMSRTAFAIRFRKTIGETPFAYLARWRIACAAERLRTEKVTIAQLSYELGYASESAFGAAFKRIKGVSPGRFAQSVAQGWN